MISPYRFIIFENHLYMIFEYMGTHNEQQNNNNSQSKEDLVIGNTID
jgi:hypothetical protein